jgi:hypothetical protein
LRNVVFVAIEGGEEVEDVRNVEETFVVVELLDGGL